MQISTVPEGSCWRLQLSAFVLRSFFSVVFPDTVQLLRRHAIAHLSLSQHTHRKLGSRRLEPAGRFLSVHKDIPISEFSEESFIGL